MYDFQKNFNEQVSKEKERFGNEKIVSVAEAQMLANVRKYYRTIFPNDIDDKEFAAEVFANLNYNIELVKVTDMYKSCKIGNAGDVSTLEKGALYISFHYGLYFLIPYLFYVKGIPVSVVSADPEDFPNCGDDVQTILSSNPLLFVDIKKRLKNGISVVLFIDAINSSPKLTVNEKFGSNIINLKTSVIKFCSTLSEKIFVIISDHIVNNSLLYNIYDINFDKGMSKQEIRDKISAKTFSILEKRVMENPSYWLSWQISDLFVNKDKSLEVKPLSKFELLKTMLFRGKEKFKFNKRCFILYEQEGGFYIMNAFTNKPIKISEVIAKSLLSEEISINKLKKFMKGSDIQLLIREQILI